MKLRIALIRDEGIRLKPYRDCCGLHPDRCTCATRGKLTIGIGRNLDDVGISREEAESMLERDIARATEAVRVRLPWTAGLDEARRGVLVMMAFNVGVSGLLGFRRMLAAAEAGEWETAAAELLDSRYAQQVGGRAVRLAEQMRSGTWP